MWDASPSLDDGDELQIGRPCGKTLGKRLGESLYFEKLCGPALGENVLTLCDSVILCRAAQGGEAVATVS